MFLLTDKNDGPTPWWSHSSSVSHNACTHYSVCTAGVIYSINIIDYFQLDIITYYVKCIVDV